MIKTSAPGNLFLGGEHRIVYGGSAIITSVDMRTYCSIDRRKDDRIVVCSKGYGKVDETIESIVSKRFDIEDFKNDEMNLARSLIQSYHTIFTFPCGFEMNVETDIPRTCKGLSRSTSFLCSSFDAVNREFNQEPFIRYWEPVPENYFHYILPLQREAHGGSASGVEITSSVFGGFHRVDNRGSRESLGRPEFHVVIGDTGVEAKTSETVPYVRTGWEKNRESYEETFSRIDNIIEEEIRAIRNKDIAELGELINQNHEILARDLGVSHPKINKLVDECRKSGAYGAKLTGGGRGGAMFALVDEENQNNVAKAISDAGGTPYVTKIGVEGLRIE